MYIRAVLVVFMTLMNVRCIGQSNAWNGTWWLDGAESRLAGSTFVMKVLPDGENQVDTGNFSFRFLCDGKQYKTVGYETIRCPKTTSSMMNTEIYVRGKLVSIVERTLSGDQSLLTQKVLATGPHAVESTQVHVYRRSSGLHGFAGAWTDVQAVSREPKLLTTSVSDFTLRLSSPSEGEYVQAKLDGSTARMEGVKSGANVTLSARLEGPLSIATEKRLNGELRSRGRLRLSEDGRSLVEESWQPDHPDAKTKLVYRKRPTP